MRTGVYIYFFIYMFFLAKISKQYQSHLSMLSWPILLKGFIYIYIHYIQLYISSYIFVTMTEVHDHIPPKKPQQNLWQIDQDRQSRPTAATLETHSWRTTKESRLSLGISGKDEQVDSKQESTRKKHTQRMISYNLHATPPPRKIKMQ